jgi:rubrerythrin
MRFDLMEALREALRAEQEAQASYKEAARRTVDPTGRKMFLEFAAFEGHHREHLEALIASLASGAKWVAYPGRDLQKGPKVRPGVDRATAEHTGAFEALHIAVEAEEAPEARYRSLALEASDEAGRGTFARLAAEEAMRRRLLDDQLYTLVNEGVWLWGD